MEEEKRREREKFREFSRRIIYRSKMEGNENGRKGVSFRSVTEQLLVVYLQHVTTDYRCCVLTRERPIPRTPETRNRPSSPLSSNFAAVRRDNPASRRNRPPEGRARRSCVSCWRTHWKRPWRRRCWKHRRWTPRRRRRRTRTPRRKPAGRYARPPATATLPTVACTDDERSRRPPRWRRDDSCSTSTSSRSRRYTPADTFDVGYRR